MLSPSPVGLGEVDGGGVGRADEGLAPGLIETVLESNVKFNPCFSYCRGGVLSKGGANPPGQGNILAVYCRPNP